MAKASSKTYDFGPGDEPGPWHISLHSTEGGSDKVYELSIEPNGGDSFTVSYANGRRGGTMATGTKAVDVDYAKAKAAAEKVLAEKVKKGYNPVASLSGHFQAGAAASIRPEDSGIRLNQLLPIEDPDALQALVESPHYAFQEKHDGQRRAIICRPTGSQGDPAAFTGVNRRGMTVPLPASILNSLYPGTSFIVDGEILGDRIVLFDILEVNGIDQRQELYRERLETLRVFFENMVIGGSVEMIKTATTPEEKRALMQEVSARGGEGVVGKDLNAAYELGRTPGQIKSKFWHTLSAIATPGRDGRNSIGLELIGDDGARLQVGNVTVPANQTVPAPGQVVEIRYLYAYDGGSLYTPTLLGVRDDVAPEECLASQRRFKPVEPVPTDEPAPGV